MVAVVSPSDSHARSAFPVKFVERVTYEVEAVHHGLAAVSSAIVIVEEHYNNTKMINFP